MSAVAALIALGVGFGGVMLGATLTRRNDRQSRSDELLAEAVNDAISAIAAVAASNSTDASAQTRYASAVSRIALHAAPRVVTAWRAFQDDATTETGDGRTRMVAAIQATRAQLGHGHASNPDLHVLLFGPGGPRHSREDRKWPDPVHRSTCCESWWLVGSCRVGLPPALNGAGA
jgi:hypothetical protein